MINVVIAEDHQLVAKGLARIISEQQDMRVADIAPTLAQTRRTLADSQPDVLLLDVAMPDGDGIDALPTLRCDSQGTRIVILTSYAEPSVVRRSLTAGADGFLLKNASVAELIEAVATAAEGRQYVCEEARQLIAGSRGDEPTLTMRERQVLKLIVEGYSIKQIADKLCLAFETVHSYTKYLRQKLGCANIASLVRVAMERHLV